jgi:signal transduction histidine kinase
MRAILETLLSTARADVAEAPGRCDVATVVACFVERARADGSHGPPIRVRPAPARCVAGVSIEIVERILTPILDNARRYAATEITIAVDNVDGRRPRIAVTDDGPGVPPGVEETLFEPGRRGDPHDGHDGAGLGLALARRLARTAGGDVVLAATGAGATFDVRLPPG